jgi:cytosine/adenosine deaminase-related metal-dependent hydrolase
MLAFRAKYVFPVDGPPLRDGVVAIDHDRIVAVGESGSPAIRDLFPAARDLGDVAILPGLVNSHAHLEFSDLRQPLGTPGMAFTKWVALVVRSRDQRSPSPVDDPIACGLAESTRSGVTAIGEIASLFWWQESTQSIEITEFCEVIGLRRDSDDQRYRKAFNAVSANNVEVDASIGWSDILRPGISPHAPYTVHPELLRRCAKLSAEQRIPLAHHLAESRDELMLLRTGRGPFVGLLEAFHAWDPNAIPFGSRSLDYLQLLTEAHRALIIHGNYLDDEEIGFLGTHVNNMSVVYCPRTHAYFQHDPYPLAKMLAVGVNVAIGTDSRASNPDLSVLADMRFAAKQHPVVPPATLLRMITANAAKALGRDEVIGTLTPGKFADLAILALPKHGTVDPHELLFDVDCHVIATIFRGRAVFGENVFSAPS